MLGQQAGVRGTPALVLETGQMLPGYLSAEDLTDPACMGPQLSRLIPPS